MRFPAVHAAALSLMGAAALALLLPVRVARAAGETSPAACAASKPGADELKLQSALDHDPDIVDTRIRLANALSDRGCYADAVKLLEAGVGLDPHSRLLQERLRSARSTQNEEGYFEGLGHAQEAAKAQRNLLRCRTLGDLSACDQALASTPADHELLTAKGDALMHANRPSEALSLYDKASAAQPADDALKAKISAAETARQTLVTRCLGETGDTALAACDQGLRHGAHDEFSIYRRKGMLLQAVDQSSRALDAYIAAAMLEPHDHAVAQAIVALTDSTGRQDPLVLSARGTALQTLSSANGPNGPAASVASVRQPSSPTAAPSPRKRSAPPASATGTVASAATFSNSEPAGESH